jgi:plasmid stabilization system protein ParE
VSVRLTPAAFADLEDIDDYATANYGPSRAIKIKLSLFETLELLAVYPKMGHARPGILAKPVRFFYRKPYWIVYQPGAPGRAAAHPSHLPRSPRSQPTRP